MYYPYLRGKQFELILLRDNAEFLSQHNIHPIIEPVKADVKALLRAINNLEAYGVNYTLIINPQVGRSLEKQIITIKDVLENDELKPTDNLFLGYIISPSSKNSSIEKILHHYSGYQFSIVHQGFSSGQTLANITGKFSNVKEHIFIENKSGKIYRKHFRKDNLSRILIRDGFDKKMCNKDYPESEHFSDLHITYDDDGMNGFGDYLIVGDSYSETGGPAYAVAIHLTYIGAEDDMFIYHFKSNRTDSPTDPAGKFLEAVEKLSAAAKKSGSLIFPSKACREFCDLYKKKHFPGLGYVKKLSMQHHIELLADYMPKD